MGNPTIGTHPFPFPKGYCHSTFAASTLITLLSEMLKISKIVICKEQNFGEGKYWIVKNTLLIKMKISKLVIYSTYMCQSC